MKTKNLQTIIKELTKKYGEGTIMKLDDKTKIDIEVISTGSISLDYILGINGIPRGRIIEIFGAESSGKTTLALHIIAEAQKKKIQCAFIDAEHALDINYANKIGVQTKEMFIVQPDSGEQALDVVESLVKSNEIGLIVIDSVAALTPQAEIDGEMGHAFIGLQARLMSQALRKLTAITSKSNTTIIFVNQTRVKIGNFYGDPTTTPGGSALKFYSSMRIEVKRAAKLKKGEEFFGNRVFIKIVKNKLAAPFKITGFDILFNEGISLESDVIAFGEKQKIIKKQGISYFFEKKKLGVGTEKAREFLKNNPDILEMIIKKIKLKNENQSKIS